MEIDDEVQTAFGSPTHMKKDAEQYSPGLTKEQFIEFAEICWKNTNNFLDDDRAIIGNILQLGKNTIDIMEAKVQELQGLTKDLDRVFGSEALKSVPKTKRAWGEKRALLTEHKERAFIAIPSTNEVHAMTALSALCCSPDGQITVIGLAKWANNGYPQITLGHKYAAALMCTEVPEDVLARVKPPWDGFFIEVPEGLLEVYDNNSDRQCKVKRILVTTRDSPDGFKWAYVAFTDTTISLWRFGVTINNLMPATIEGNRFEHDPLCLELTDQDDRTAAMIGRLVINSCLAITDKSCVKEIGPGHKSYSYSKKVGRRGPPLVRTFQVGKPITIDLRKEVSDYIQKGTKRREARVQSLVCGHFKGQHYGPKNSLYKIIWREPFWRGPADAPILMRPHLIKVDDE